MAEPKLGATVLEKVNDKTNTRNRVVMENGADWLPTWNVWLKVFGFVSFLIDRKHELGELFGLEVWIVGRFMDSATCDCYHKTNDFKAKDIASMRMNMNIELPADAAQFIESLVASGQYGSVDEAVADGVQLLMSRQQLRADVQKGIKEMDAGQGVAGQQVFAELRERASKLTD